MADLAGRGNVEQQKKPNIAAIVANRMCHGCGACAYACRTGAISLHNFIDEGIRPVVDADRCNTCGECVAVCSGASLTHDQTKWPNERIKELEETWGPIMGLWEGHAGDDETWFRGGSGGAATALSLYCLEQKHMYGVLHVGMDSDRPYLNRIGLSTQREDLLNGTGSRYAPAAVCAELQRIEEAPAPVVLIGKPCDIASARMAARTRPELESKIGLTIAIFCAGTPSTRAVLEVLQQLNVEPDNVSDMRFRGFGWPGMTGVGLKAGDGERVEMTYRQAWDTILTVHKPWRCQICADGTGEFADLSCGDPWYRTIQPGEKGSSLIVARTPLGREVLQQAMASGYIDAETCDPTILPRSQIGQERRRHSIWPKLFASAILGLPFPKYRGFSLWRNWRKPAIKAQFTSLQRALRYALSLRRRGSYRLGERDARGADRILNGRQCTPEQQLESAVDPR